MKSGWQVNNRGELGILSILYGKFLDTPEGLDTSELKALKEEFENGLYPEYAERNINKIDKILNKNQRLEEHQNEQEERWYRKVVKDKEVKEVWESHGAYFKSNGYSTTWYLGETPFYTWYSRANVDEQHPKLLAAHERFKELISDET